MDAVRFGLSMRALRRRRRWTQQRLADEVGVSRSVVARIEQGHGDRVTVRTLVSVAAALGEPSRAGCSGMAKASTGCLMPPTPTSSIGR
jgi:transcriptional regulator with XRE-family HTH domain